MDIPPPDPTKLLEAWMEWERGETPPGRVMATLKTGGLRNLLEELVAAGGGSSASGPVGASGSPGAPEPDAPSTEAWTPVV